MFSQLFIFVILEHFRRIFLPFTQNHLELLSLSTIFGFQMCILWAIIAQKKKISWCIVKVVLFIFVILDHFRRSLHPTNTKSLGITFTINYFLILDIHLEDNSRQYILQKTENHLVHCESSTFHFCDNVGLFSPFPFEFKF